MLQINMKSMKTKKEGKDINRKHSDQEKKGGGDIHTHLPQRNPKLNKEMTFSIYQTVVEWGKLIPSVGKM